MADYDWGRVAIEAFAGAASGLSGLIIGAWRWGRSSAETEQSIRDDYDGKINALREHVRVQMAEYEKQATARMDLLLGQIRETLEGLRRQMDELRYHNEHYFLPKNDFDKFRIEYREDTQRISDKLDALIAKD